MEDLRNRVMQSGQKFIKDSQRLLKKCSKPTQKEYKRIVIATAIGFFVIGLIGFFVKLVHIPITKVLVH